MNLISLKNDYAFKELFTYENVRKQFISDVLGIPLEQIRSVRIVNSFLWKRYRKQKQGILDVALELNDDTGMDIEMQVRRQEHWIKRKLFYLAQSFTEDLKAGQDYGRLRKCISISILDFNLLDGEKYHSIFSLRDKAGKELTDLFEIHIIELRKPLYGADGIDDWIQLFNAKETEDLDMITVKNTGIGEAIEAVKTMSLGKSLRYLYNQHMKAVRDRRAEDEYVRNQGKAEGKIEAILELLGESGEIPPELKEKIEAQEDMDVLAHWLKTAAKAEDIPDFRERCQL